MTQYLFMNTEIQVCMDAARRALIDEVEQLSNSAILSQGIDQWLGHLRDKYTIHVPALDLTKVDRTFADGLVPQYQVPNPNVHTPSGV